VLDAAQRRGLIPGLLDRVVGHLGIVLTIGRLDGLAIGGIDILTAARRAAVHKGRIISSRNVTQIAGQVHGLMIADQGDNLAMGSVCFALQAHQILDDLEGIRATIHGITGLDQHRLPADPTACVIHQLRGAGDIAPGSEVAVEVAHRDDPVKGRWRSRRRHGQAPCQSSYQPDTAC